MKDKICALAVFGACIGGLVALKLYAIIAEASFVTLTVVCSLVALFIGYSKNLKSINLIKGELILKDMKETEASVKELAKAILEVTESSSHAIMLESFDEEAQQKAIEKLRKLTT